MSRVFYFPVSPPSVNNLFVNLRRGGRARSTGYSQWRDGTVLALKAQRSKMHAMTPLDSPLELHYYIKPSRMDLGNGEKALTDALVAAGILKDDKFSIVRRIVMEWGVYTPGEPEVLCVITEAK